MTVSRCEMSDLPTEQCDHCSRGASQLAPAKPDADRVMPAGFPSRCPGCGKAIATGDRLGLVDGLWLCGRCFS